MVHKADGSLSYRKHMLNVAEPLAEEPTWTAVRAALQLGGFDSAALSDAYPSGNRLLASLAGCG